MKKTTFFIAIFLMVLSHSFVHGQASDYNPNEIIIKWAAGTTPQQQANIINQMGATVVDEIPNKETLVYIPSFPFVVNGNTYNSLIETIEVTDDTAEIDDTDFNYTVTATPFSPEELLASLDMEVYSPIPPDCESVYPGGPLQGNTQCEGNIKIAILDSGVSHHPNNWITTQYIQGEINALTYGLWEELTGGNGAPSAPVIDYHGHGTSVAGIIAGLSHSAGLTPENLSLYIIEMIESDGTTSLFNAIKGLEAAIYFQPNLINISWSYTPVEEDLNSQILESKLRYLSDEENVIIVVGAGNNGQSLNTFDLAPAGFTDISNMITVAGTDCYGERSWFSNFGTPVNISAPAENIIAPVLDGYWGIGNQGTSFAAPIVCAAFAQVWTTYYSSAPAYVTPAGIDEIQNIILSTAVQIPSNYNTLGGLVNFTDACALAEYLAPSDPMAHLTGDLRNTNDIQQKNISKKHSKVTQVIDMYITPNPFSERFFLSLETKEKVEIEVWTMFGEKIINKKVKGFEVEYIEVYLGSTYPAGLYIVKIKQNGYTESKLIIKE